MHKIGEFIENGIGRNNASYFYQIFSQFLFFLIGVNVRDSDKIDPLICSFFRGIMGYILTYPHAVSHKIDITFKGSMLKRIVIRNILVVSAMIITIYSFKILPIELSYIIQNMNPMVMYVVNWLFFGVELHLKNIVCLIISLGFVTLIVVQNAVHEYLFGVSLPGIESSEITQPMEVSKEVYFLMVGILFLSNFLLSYGFLMVPKYRMKPIQVLNNAGIVYVVSSAIGSIFVDLDFSGITLNDLILPFIFQGLLCDAAILIQTHSFAITENSN